MRRLLIGLLTVAAGCATAANKDTPAPAFDWGAYRRVTLSELTKGRPTPPKDAYTLDSGGDGYRVKVTVTGNKRSVPTNRKTLIELWGKAHKPHVNVRALFANEVQVQDGAESLWLPIQSVLEPALAEETRPGEEVDVLVTCFGAVDGQWLFVVNEFQAVEVQPTSPVR